MNKDIPSNIRNLIIILGDQLDLESAALRDFDPEKDIVWMAEVIGESKYARSSKIRTALFLSAMRHFRRVLVKKKYKVLYTELDDKANKGQLGMQLKYTLSRCNPESIRLIEPGEYRLIEALSKVSKECGVKLEFLEDEHFLASHEDFKSHATGRKQLRMEYFYREMRKRYDVLMEHNKPKGGAWNFDASNRKSFGKSGPELIAQRRNFKQDEITQAVIALVNKELSDHPGD